MTDPRDPDDGLDAHGGAPRHPDAVLAALGADLRAAWAAPPRRRRLAGWLRLHRVAVVALATVLFGVPTAVATRDALRAPGPPALPDAMQAPGRVAADAVGRNVWVAAGEAGGIAWRLSASSCAYGDGVRAVGVFLHVPGGGAGARCDVAAADLPPAAIARRRVHTYFDPVSQRTWTFGTVPPAARTVEVGPVTVAAEPADPAAIAGGRLPPGLRVFVAVVRDGSSVVARDVAGVELLRCRDGSCTSPDPENP